MWSFTLHRWDEVRRTWGDALDDAGVGREETPSHDVLRHDLCVLRAYEGLPPHGPKLLLIPAPIKRAYLWDLLPEVSVVRRCLDAGIRVFLLDWLRPRPDQEDAGLEDYAHRAIGACVERIAADGAPLFLAGHSLGGTFAAFYAALHPERVAGLIMLGAPLRFGPHIGAFGPMTAFSMPAAAIRAMFGNVPGSYLSATATAASPFSFQFLRKVDRLCSLRDPSALRIHVAVERWSLDESPMAGRLYEEVVEELYRGDAFMCGRLQLGGRRLFPELVRAPLLSVLEANSSVVPPAAVLPFHDRVASQQRTLLWYRGDTGTALKHVGMLVGRSAHREMWPWILRWIVKVESETGDAAQRPRLGSFP